MKVSERLLFWLQVSRPGLWFPTMWLYLLPAAGSQPWTSWPFWLGLAYVMFPLNFFLYGINDMADRVFDQTNPRKGNFWFGARGTVKQLRSLWLPMIVVQVAFIVLIVWATGAKFLLLFAAFLVISLLYNHPRIHLSRRSPLELIVQCGYVLVVPMSIWINDLTPLGWATYTYLILFSMQSHLMGEVMDYYPDRESGKITTCVRLGIGKTKMLIIGIVAFETAMLIWIFRDLPFSLFMSSALLWLLIDWGAIFRTKAYNWTQMRLFAIGSNALAVITMAYIWYSGCLVVY